MSQCRPHALLRFLRGDMAPKETQRLVRHLENCSECRERLQVMSGLMAVEKGRNFSGSWTHYGRLGLLAAGLAAALVLPLVWRAQPETRLAEIATHQPHPLFPLQTRAKAPAAGLSEALQRYANAQYAEAERLLADFPEDPEALFFRGVCLYFLGRFEEAVQTLDKARSSGPPLAQPAAWYRANALLQAGSANRAKAAFEEIAGSSGRFSNDARKVLDRLSEKEH